MYPFEWNSLEISHRVQCQDDGTVSHLLDRWEKRLVLGSDDPGLFDRRLTSLGLDRKSVRGWLAPNCLSHDAILPDWALSLAEILDAGNYDLSNSDIFLPSLAELSDYSEEELRVLDLLSPEKPLFPEFLHPFATWAFRKIGPLPLLNGKIAAQLGRYLVSRLSLSVARTVSYEIKKPATAVLLRGDTPEERYSYYTGQILGTPEGILSLYEKYPVLARLHTECAQRFVAYISEIFRNLDQEMTLLEKCFNNGFRMGRIIEFQAGLSDPHNQGKTVCFLEFESGQKILYKPRSLAIDEACNSLVRWLNDIDSQLCFHECEILDMEDHGWVRFVETLECRTLCDVAEYYMRQGFHLALFFLLCGEDFHYGNFIPKGRIPVPIDLEGLMAPGVHTIPPELPIMDPEFHPLPFTILSSVMIPNWRAGADTMIFHEFSGINGRSSRHWPLKFPVWKNLRTDQLKLEHEFPDRSRYDSRPIFQGDRPSVDEYLDELEKGFSQCCTIFMENRDYLLSESSPLQRFKGVQVRCMTRDTNDYSDLLFWSSAPDQLVSGAAHFIALEMICRRESRFGQGLNLVDSEKESLFNGDIPIFTGFTDSCALYLDQKKSIERAVERDAFSQVLQRVRELSVNNCNWQIRLMRTAFRISFEKGGKRGAQSVSSKQRFLDNAVLIGDALERLALKNSRGTVWLDLIRSSGASTSVSYCNMDPFLLRGTSGTALFMASLYAHTNEERFKILAGNAFGHTLHVFEKMALEMADYEIPLSAFTGIAGVIYALVEAGRLLNDEFYVDRALDLALEIESRKLSDEPCPDLMTGSSGVILSLLHLHRVRQDSKIILMCRSLADSIMKCSAGNRGENGWNVPGFHRPLMGMAHGAAGIALALSRLNKVSPDSRFIKSVENSLEFEKRNFSVEKSDWPNFQSMDAVPSFMKGWCAGAPGFGLARLRTEHPDPEVRAIVETDIDRALAATLFHLDSGKRHHLCCGESGRICFLLESGLKRKSTELIEKAMNGGNALIDYYECTGHWRFQDFNERSIIPGLMNGVSGIGLTLLKLVDSEKTSNVLTLD